MAFLSIEIGPGRITAVQGTVTGNAVELTAAETAPLRRGLITEGVIKNKPELTAALTRLLQGNTAFNAKKAFVTVNQANAFVREFSIPDGSAKQLDAMVNSEMHNYNSAASSDVIEYKVLEKLVGDNGAKSARIRAYSVGKGTVDAYCAALQDARLKPAAMDINPNAVDKLLTHRPLINGISQAENSFLLLDFGYPGIMTYIVYDYAVVASRFIPIGLADIDTGRIYSEDPENAPPDFSKSLDFSKKSAAEPGLMRSAEEVMQQCCNEIQKLIMFSTGKISRNTISTVYITGEGSVIPGADKHIAAELNLLASPITDLSAIHFADKSLEGRLPYVLNAAGALIRL